MDERNVENVMCSLVSARSLDCSIDGVGMWSASFFSMVSLVECAAALFFGKKIFCCVYERNVKNVMCDV